MKKLIVFLAVSVIGISVNAQTGNDSSSIISYIYNVSKLAEQERAKLYIQSKLGEQKRVKIDVNKTNESAYNAKVGIPDDYNKDAPEFGKEVCMLIQKWLTENGRENINVSCEVYTFYNMPPWRDDKYTLWGVASYDQSKNDIVWEWKKISTDIPK